MWQRPVGPALRARESLLGAERLYCSGAAPLMLARPVRGKAFWPCVAFRCVNPLAIQQRRCSLRVQKACDHEATQDHRSEKGSSRAAEQVESVHLRLTLMVSSSQEQSLRVPYAVLELWWVQNLRVQKARDHEATQE